MRVLDLTVFTLKPILKSLFGQSKTPLKSSEAKKVGKYKLSFVVLSKQEIQSFPPLLLGAEQNTHEYI